MNTNKKARSPFRFYTRLNLSELTGLKATNLPELLEIIETVPGACIYHHTHRFLQQHQYLSPEPPNDFAFWVAESIGDDELAERLASIDTIRFGTIRDLRNKIVATITDHLSANASAARRFAQAGDEFHFIKSMSFVLPTTYVARSLRDFAEILKQVTIDSIYFHMFEARLRLERGTNDFSVWLDTSLGETELAQVIARLDPYTRTLDDLRKTLIQHVERRMAAQ
jgi:hypothetical protein